MGVKVHKSRDGFALVEGLLLLVIVAAIIGVGVFVTRQKHSAEKLLSSSNTTAQSTASPGTTAHIDQLTQQDAKDEANVDSANDGSTQLDATSANSVVSNVGGAYNEANY